MPSNVTRLPTPLTFNELFLRSFVDEEAPCAALGLVREAGQTRGFVAVQLNENLPSHAERFGFDFGFEMLGTSRYQLMHFILSFPELGSYDILFNPNNPLVRKVVEVMHETAQYFFFVFREGGMSAFHQVMSQENLDWFNTYGDIVHTATTTGDEYEIGLERFAGDNRFLSGKLLRWVCRDNQEFLDLQQHPFEVRAG